MDQLGHRLLCQIACVGFYVDVAIRLFSEIVLFAYMALFNKFIYVYSHEFPKEVSFD